MNDSFEVGDKIGDKAGNKYEIKQRRNIGAGRRKPEFLLLRSDGVERWIDEEIVESFSFRI